jgi:hypothetical protein
MDFALPGRSGAPRATAAPRTIEFDQLTVDEEATRASLVDDVLDRIAAACHPAELDGIVRDMWVDHTNGLLAEAQMEVLDEAARARREAIWERRQAAQRESPERSSRSSRLASCRGAIALRGSPSRAWSR